MLKDTIFHNISIFLHKIMFFGKKNEKLKISTNNIINVETTKLLWWFFFTFMI